MEGEANCCHAWDVTLPNKCWMYRNGNIMHEKDSRVSVSTKFLKNSDEQLEESNKY